MSGLAEAAMSYDPDTGVPFHRFAAIRIKGAVLDELRSADWTSRGARARSKELGSAEEQLAQRLGRSPTAAEMSAHLGVSLAELDRRRAETARSLTSLDALDAAVGQSIPDAAPDPGDRVVHAERIGYLHAAVDALPDRSQAVIAGLFFQQRSVSEIAAELGVTESRVSQLKTEALGLLHDALEVTHGDTEPSKPAPAKGAGARRRQEYYAAVAANATAAGLGAQAALIEARHRDETTRSAQRKILRTSPSRSMG